MTPTPLEAALTEIERDYAMTDGGWAVSHARIERQGHQDVLRLVAALREAILGIYVLARAERTNQRAAKDVALVRIENALRGQATA